MGNTTPRRREPAPEPKQTGDTPKKPQVPSLARHSDATKARALVEFRKRGTVLHACEAAGISRSAWYDWMENDPAFAGLVASAVQDVTDELESAAYTRATAAEGGSDTLLIFLLKSRRPEVYRERQEVTLVSADVKERLQQTVRLVGSRKTWNSPELLTLLHQVWQ